MQCAPVRTFITHGEPAAADALRRRIAERLHWPCEVPAYAQCVDLDEVATGGAQESAAIASRLI
jgi:metallo-beta-lactamase family protein